MNNNNILFELKRLCENILAKLKSEGTNIISFTSPINAEGCSTISLGVSHYMTKYKNLNTLLIDANLYKPGLSEWFKSHDKKGISDIVFNKTLLDEAIMPSGQENLSFLSIGKEREINKTIFSHPGFVKLLHEIKKNFQIVIFDSPPVNISPDAAILSSKLDGTVLVIEAERTRWEVAKKAKATIEENGNILGVVMNKRKYHIPDMIYSLL